MAYLPRDHGVMMDATTQAFVTEIVSRRIAENWLYWLLFLAASFLAAFSGGYIRRRAENLATRDDFEELKRQLQQTTRITEDIKAEISHREWKAREVNSIRRQKLEDVMRQVSALDVAVRDYMKAVSQGDSQKLITLEIDALAASVNLYFPSLVEEMTTYTESCRDLIVWAMDRGELVVQANRKGATPERLKELSNETAHEAGSWLFSNSRAKISIERAASQLMQELLTIAPHEDLP